MLFSAFGGFHWKGLLLSTTLRSHRHSHRLGDSQEVGTLLRGQHVVSGRTSMQAQ